MIEPRHSARLALALAATSALVATSARAVDVQLAVEDELEYNSNFLGEDGDARDAWRSRLGPHVNLRDLYGRLTYELDYRGIFDWYLDEYPFNAWENYVRASGGYAISPRTQVTVNNLLYDVSSVRFSAQEISDGVFVLDGGRSPFMRNSFQSAIEHYFTQRWVGTMSVANDWIDFAQNDSQADSITMGATANIVYVLTPRDRVGVGGSFNYQRFDFDAAQPQPGSRGRIWDAFVSWAHSFDDGWRFAMSGGPSWIESELDTAIRAREGVLDPLQPGRLFAPSDCEDPARPGVFRESFCVPGTASDGLLFGQNPLTSIVIAGGRETSVTFFGQFSLSKEWDEWRVAASYVRRQSNAAGDGTASTADIARFGIDWEPSRLWSLYVDAGWNRRSRVNDQLTDFVLADNGSGTAIRVGAITSNRGRDIDQFTALIGGRRRFTRHVNGFAEFRYRHQIDDRPRGGSQTIDFYLFTVKVEYLFDPFRL